MTLSLRDTLQKLSSYANAPYPVLSVYLAIPNPVPTPEKLQKTFLETLYDAVSEVERSRIQIDIGYIETYLEDLSHFANCRGIALFSGGNQLWEVVTTPFPLPNLISLNHHPYLKPLQEKIDDYKRYLVLIAEREKTKYFTLFLGNIEDQEEFRDEVPQKVKGRNMADRAGKIDRHIEQHLSRHFKTVADHIKAFIAKKHVEGVIIGGHKELFRNVEKYLPKNLQRKIIAEFAADTDADINSLISKSKQIIKQVNTGAAYNFGM